MALVYLLAAIQKTLLLDTFSSIRRFQSIINCVQLMSMCVCVSIFVAYLIIILDSKAYRKEEQNNEPMCPSCLFNNDRHFTIHSSTALIYSLDSFNITIVSHQQYHKICQNSLVGSYFLSISKFFSFINYCLIK